MYNNKNGVYPFIVCIITDMKKPANRANLVSGHLFEKMWLFCHNSNKSKTNHTFLKKIDHIEERNFKISINLLQMRILLQNKLVKLPLSKLVGMQSKEIF